MNIESLREKAGELSSEIIEIRHRFHAHPELPWKETETSRFVEEYLRDLGLTNIVRGFGGTESGVLADLVGGKPGKCVALRADIDALPLTEENDLPYKSTCPGIMHACGHDAHTAMMLGAAKILSSCREDLCGTVRFLFSPPRRRGTTPALRP